MTTTSEPDAGTGSEEPVFDTSDLDRHMGVPIRPGELNDDVSAGDVRRCSIITQEVVLQGGQREQRQVKACRQADGTWVTV